MWGRQRLETLRVPPGARRRAPGSHRTPCFCASLWSHRGFSAGPQRPLSEPEKPFLGPERLQRPRERPQRPRAGVATERPPGGGKLDFQKMPLIASPDSPCLGEPWRPPGPWPLFSWFGIACWYFPVWSCGRALAVQFPLLPLLDMLATYFVLQRIRFGVIFGSSLEFLDRGHRQQSKFWAFEPNTIEPPLDPHGAPWDPWPPLPLWGPRDERHSGGCGTILTKSQSIRWHSDPIQARFLQSPCTFWACSTALLPVKAFRGLLGPSRVCARPIQVRKT